jgi:DedD protein
LQPKPIDVGSEPAAPAGEARQKRLLNRIAVGLLVAAGLFGAWVMRDVTAPAVPGMPAMQRVTPAHQAGVPTPDGPPAAIAPPAEISYKLPSDVSPIVPPAVPPVASPVAPPVAVATAPAALPVSPVMPKDEHVNPSADKTFVSQLLKGKPPVNGLFGVQMGVFKVATNAENLHAKIHSQDIPVLMETRPGETRVHAGPFASRAEAEHIRAKLEAAGMGKGMLVILRH